MSSNQNIQLHLNLDIVPPPTFTIQVSNLKKCSRDSLLEVTLLLLEKKPLFRNLDKYLKVELNLLKQLLYKNKNRFRNDKGYKDAQIIHKNWMKFQNIMLLKAHSSFHESLPLPLDVKNLHREKLFLPTVQMLQYFMVKLRGSFHQLFKIWILIENGSELALQRIQLGHFWNLGLVHMALFSRLWTLCQCFLKNVLDVYSGLHKLFALLPSNDASWCPHDYRLPSNLQDDLSEVELEQFNSRIKSQLGTLNQKSLLPVRPEENSKSDLKPDVGTIIERKEKSCDSNDVPVSGRLTPDQIEIPCSKKHFKKLQAALETLKNPDMLSAFLTSETKSRKVDRKKSLTKKLDQQQWRELRDCLKKHLDLFSQETKKPKQFMKKLHKMLIWWILYPQLKGARPLNWDKILSKIIS